MFCLQPNDLHISPSPKFIIKYSIDNDNFITAHLEKNNVPYVNLVDNEKNSIEEKLKIYFRS